MEMKTARTDQTSPQAAPCCLQPLRLSPFPPRTPPLSRLQRRGVGGAARAVGSLAPAAACHETWCVMEGTTVTTEGGTERGLMKILRCAVS